MAYTPYYNISFQNEQIRTAEVVISKKDGAPVDVLSLKAVDLSFTDNGDTDEKDNWLVIRKMELQIDIPQGSPVTWESFISDDYLDWKVYCTIDGHPWFEGFIVPDEGFAPFLDPPYTITVQATNGLALLKNTPLVDVNGDDFVSNNSLIKYIAGALKQTGLELPIRVYCSILNISMLNKGNGLEYDMFSQTFLDYRGFRKSATTFTSCHEALQSILKKFCVLEYWNGMWQITCLQDRQAVPGDWFYVDYDANGDNPVGAQVTENYGQVGKSMGIYPINETQEISSKFAVKSTRTFYNYTIFPELYNNEGLSRLGPIIPGISGDILDVDDEDGDGDTSEVIGTYQGYELSGWVHKKNLLGEVDAITNAYIRVEKDLFDRETSRFYVVERDATAPVDVSILNYIRPANSDFYVKKGDKFDISITAKLDVDVSTIFNTCSILIFTGGSTSDPNNYWRLNEFGWFQQSAPTASAWAQFSGGDLDLADWQTLSQNQVTIPVDGVLMILLNDGFSGANEGHFKDLKITYYIFVGGSYFQATGDYWLRSQDKTYPNKEDEEIFMSDGLRRITKGAMLFINGSVDALTDPTWYRFNEISDPNPGGVLRHFKELINIGAFNDRWRRFYKIEGDWDGLNYIPENDQLNPQPFGFHRKYQFSDMGPERYFVPVTPVKYDIGKGWINLTFEEVYVTTSDGTQLGDSSTFDYIFNES